MFFVSYTGQSQQDNAALPPSVLVSELLDTLEQSSRFDDGIGLTEHIVFKQFLQPFNAHYFMPGSPGQSYSAQYCACARAFTGGSTAAPDFFDPPLPAEQQNGDAVLNLADLVRFFKNPSAYLLRERLNVSLDPQVFSIVERESFRLGGLERYSLEQVLLQEIIADPKWDGSFEQFAARGILPHAAAGRAAYVRSLQSVRSFVCDVHGAGLSTETAESRLVELALDGCTLSAFVSLSLNAGLVHMRHAAIKPIDFVRIWLEYLLCSAADAEAPSAMLAGLDPKNRRTQLWQFSPVADPFLELTRIMALYHEGLCRPLALMPKASCTYAEALHAGKTEQQARIAAAKCLEQDDYSKSELDDACFGRFFNEAIVESPDFDRCAREVFGPIVQHRKRV